MTIATKPVNFCTPYNDVIMNFMELKSSIFNVQYVKKEKLYVKHCKKYRQPYTLFER